MNGQSAGISESPKRGSWKWLLGAILLLLAASLAVMLLADGKLRPYEDLKPSQASVPDASTNGYLFLEKRWKNAPSISTRDQEQLLAMAGGGKPLRVDFVAKCRKGHENGRKEFNAALAMPHWVDPTSSLAAGTWLYGPVRLFQLDAANALRAGDVGPSIALHRDLALFARRHLEGARSRYFLAVANLFQTMAAELCCGLLAGASLDGKALRELEQIWRDDPSMAQAGRAVLQRHAMSAESVLLKSGSGEVAGLPIPLPDRVFIKKHRTLNLWNSLTRKLMPVVFQPFPTLESAEAAGYGMEVPAGIPQAPKLLDLNSDGRKWAVSNMQATAFSILNEYRSLFVPRAMRVRLAVHRWRQVHPEKWPATLAELVPDYLPEVPKDPWNDAPLLWDQATRTVYAVGRDWRPETPLFDTGPYSTTAPKNWLEIDPVNPGLRMEIPPPAPPKSRVMLGNP